jgi:hypothetical protein
MLGYNLRFCLDTSADEAEEAARQAAVVEAGGAEAGEQHQQQRARGMPAEPPLRFRPAVHRACTFPVSCGRPATAGWSARCQQAEEYSCFAVS